MIVRYYDEYSVSEICGIIIAEIEKRGKSSGWVARYSLDYLEKVKSALEKYNVFYVSDFDGTWALISK